VRLNLLNSTEQKMTGFYIEKYSYEITMMPKHFLHQKKIEKKTNNIVKVFDRNIENYHVDGYRAFR